MDDDIEKSDYFIKRHNLRVAEDETDPFKEAQMRRNVLVLNQHSSISLTSNATTCSLLEDDLNAYATVIDTQDKGKVNNYADAAVYLASSCKTDSKKWKSHLHKQKIFVSDIISNLKCQNCSNWEAPKQLANLFSELPNNPGGTASPSRIRKTSEKGFPLLRDFPKLVIPKDVCSPQNILAPGNILKEGQGSRYKSDQSGKTDFSFAVNPLGKNMPSTTPPVAPSGRFNFNTAKNEDQPNFNKNFSSRLVPDSTVSDAGCTWNIGKPVDPPRDFQSNLKEFPSNYDDCYGNVPPGRAFPRNDRGGGYGQRGGRGFGATGTRHRSDDQYRSLPESSVACLPNATANAFKTARDELVDQNAKKNNGYGRGQGGGYGSGYNCYDNGNSGGVRGGLQYGAQKRSLGTSRRGGGVYSKFVPPVRPEGEDQTNRQEKRNDDSGENGEVDERLKNIDPKMIELIKNEIMDISAPVCWDDIAGLEFAKSTIQEIVVWPMMRPDIFTGLRKPPKGLLLFGPPGTGKTLIGKCIASQSQSTFFSISASSLTSKWIGDGEKMVRALFAVAKCYQPAVVFIDEIDSLLTQRSDTEHESSRRIKTEFLVQLDGAGTEDEERILVVGATNRPQELDEAARRRLVKRLYIPLPEFEARRQIVERLMSSERNDLSVDEINEIAKLTEGYSGADMKNVCQEASLGPIRSLSFSDMHQISAEQVRPVNFHDFKTALQRVRASVSQKDLDQYVIWDQTYGMSGGF